MAKINEAAFLYLDPKEPKEKFAQCAACMMFTGSTCTIHGKDVKITGKMSCGLYVHGKPMPEEKGHEMKSVTPKESGLVDRQVRCENCKFYHDPNICDLFGRLNKEGSFDLNTKVNQYGCCNAQEPKESEFRTAAREALKEVK